MKRKSFLDKHANLIYAFAIFFYIDLSLATIYLLSEKEKSIDQQIKEDAEEIFNTPDLITGLEELEEAVEMDLKDLEKSLKKNS